MDSGFVFVFWLWMFGAGFALAILVGFVLSNYRMRTLLVSAVAPPLAFVLYVTYELHWVGLDALDVSLGGLLVLYLAMLGSGVACSLLGGILGERLGALARLLFDDFQDGST